MPHTIVPDLHECDRFAEVRLRSEEESEVSERTLEACSSVLSQRAAYIMELFHAGDCDELVAFANKGARRAEARFIAFLLDDLNDQRARELFIHAFSLDRSDALDAVEELRDTSEFLAPAEGCHPALCDTGNEPACSPWFGLKAPGACIPVRFGPSEGCMPAYCMEDHELLTLAARHNWNGARSTLLRELVHADGYVWGSLCHCGVRGGIADHASWEKLASGQEEKEALQDCLADTPGNTTASCWTVRDRKSGRVCGQASPRAAAVTSPHALHGP